MLKKRGFGVQKMIFKKLVCLTKVLVAPFFDLYQVSFGFVKKQPKIEYFGNTNVREHW